MIFKVNDTVIINCFLLGQIRCTFLIITPGIPENYPVRLRKPLIAPVEK